MSSDIPSEQISSMAESSMDGSNIWKEKTNQIYIHVGTKNNTLYINKIKVMYIIVYSSGSYYLNARYIQFIT